jgi:hypothetical protein
MITVPRLVQSTVEGGHHAMLTLQYGEYIILFPITFSVILPSILFSADQPPITENFLLDTGCKPDLYIPQELADRLGVPHEFYRQGVVKGTGDIRTRTPFFIKPVSISYSWGRDSLRETIATKTYVSGGQNILGRDAMRRMRIGIPESADSIILYNIDEEEEVL